uniref:Uncharacterized protein n=1 Tax=Panagrolaimus davidi TaxID=227884 RepID=A0A914PQX7_9BILA
MSFSATIILRATCDSVTSLHGETMQYTFEEGARVRDLVKFAAENYALGSTYMFQLKWKTLDTGGLPKSTILLPSSLVTHGEMYYMFINTRDDLELEFDSSQMVLQTPMALTSPMTPVSSSNFMTPNTSQQYRRIFGNIQSPSTSFSAMSVNAAASEVTSFPVSQTSDYCDPNATPRRRLHRMGDTTITHEPTGTSAAAAANEVEDATTPDSCETSASTSGSTSTDTSTAAAPGGSNILPIRLFPDRGVSKGKFLGMLYSQNQDIMDKTFAPMTKEPMIFYDINVTERMSSTPCTIAAFVLISHRGFADYDIRVGTIARDICQKFVVDLVMDVKKSTTVSRDNVKPLVKYLNGITRANFFDYLITPDGPLFAAIRKRESRQSASNGFTPGKKRKLMLPPAPMDDVNKAANAAATAHTQEEIAAIVKNSRQVFIRLFNF